MSPWLVLILLVITSVIDSVHAGSRSRWFDLGRVHSQDDAQIYRELGDSRYLVEVLQNNDVPKTLGQLSEKSVRKIAVTSRVSKLPRSTPGRGIATEKEK
jgi:hypothetical protein